MIELQNPTEEQINLLRLFTSANIQNRKLAETIWAEDATNTDPKEQSAWSGMLHGLMDEIALEDASKAVLSEVSHFICRKVFGSIIRLSFEVSAIRVDTHIVLCSTYMDRNSDTEPSGLYIFSRIRNSKNQWATYMRPSYLKPKGFEYRRILKPYASSEEVALAIRDNMENFIRNMYNPKTSKYYFEN